MREGGAEKAEELYLRLISPIEKRMAAIVSRIVQDESEAADVFQEVLATVWTKLPRIDRHPNPQAYIIRICLSRSYDALRERARRRARGDVRLETDLSTEPGRQMVPADNGHAQAAIRDAVASLPPKQAQAVLLRALDDASYEAIARVLECSPVTARSHFAKGTARLRRILEKSGKL